MMTPKEFKAWFEGFTEAMDGMPTETQWKKVKDRVAQIDGNPVSYPVYVDRYLPQPRRYWESPFYWTSNCTGAGGLRASDIDEKLASYTTKHAGITASEQQPKFDSYTAMYVAGKADYDEMSAE